MTSQKVMKFGQLTEYNVRPEICSILIFHKSVRDYLSPQHLVTIVQEELFSCYILLTDQISLPGCIYFL